MRLISHDGFFVFYNGDPDAVNMVYHLITEAMYRLIIPE